MSFATVNRWEGGTNLPQKAAQEVITALARDIGVEPVEETSELRGPAADVTRRRRAGAATPSTKPMEQMLWDAACSIRGEKDAAKFKDYLLPLLFLKRLSDVFDDEITRLAEEYGDRETALEIAESDQSLLRFYLLPLTPGRSIAVDNSLHVYGTPFFIQGGLPLSSEKRTASFDRLMIAQDTGSAIVGPARADIYWGAGDQAGHIAGRIRLPGKFAMLVPRELDPVAAEAGMPLPPAGKAAACCESSLRAPTPNSPHRVHLRQSGRCSLCPAYPFHIEPMRAGSDAKPAWSR